MLNWLRAALIMLKAHKGQKDKAGMPYFLHPLRVSMSVKDERAKVVALLHDVLEDSEKYEISDFYFLDCEQKEALKLLTHNKNDSYFNYIKDIKSNKMASMIKTMDLKDNMNLNRLKDVSVKDIERYRKYEKAMSILN